ncbi:MAG: CRISPR-associated protein [Bacillota bacterium]|nr:CRISPR-associated protein [Bacillota bacterium]
MDFNEEDLKRVTKEYWSHNSDLDSRLVSYICCRQRRLGNRSLLEAELEYGRVTANPCETLVLLVGFSLEPLLQSVCVYKPQKIVLVLNEEGYEGEEWYIFATHIVKAVRHLKNKGLIQKEPLFLGEQESGKVGYPAQDKPAAVFKTLVEVLHDEKDVVIDVTGGKKSMVTGAYMYAAYAGARISYVDFEDYDPSNRRPYGFSCKIGELSNPYQEFALREWEHVRTLYERYQFREARELLLDVILGSMKTVIRGTEEPIQKLGAFLDYYEKWDRGDFRGAKQAAQALGAFEQPSAVVELGDQWYEISGSAYANIPGRFYGNHNMLQVYVYDELKRIRRLIEYNQDYRSTFLRAGGVNEIIMLARVVQLVTDPTERNLLLDALDKNTPNAWNVFEALSDPNKTQIGIGYKKDITFEGFRKKTDPEIIMPRPSPMTAWWQKTNMFSANDGWKRFLDIRNELAHKYFSVPQEWAEEALKFVEANFEDFVGQPVDKLPWRATALSWFELCELCGMSRFLPPNFRKEVHP